MANENSQEARRRYVNPSDFPSPNNFPLHELNTNIRIPTYKYNSSAEYATAVNKWLWQCYNWQCVTIGLPYLISQTASRLQANTLDGSTDLNRNFPNTFFLNQNFGVSPGRPNAFPSNRSGTVFLIPSLCKRLLAEAIDFCILLVLKVMITYIAVDYFDFVNLEKYDLDILKNDKLDYQTAMEVTSEIVALEIIHRFVVCIFEGLFTHKGLIGQGGATPGKSIMKLRIVSCTSVVQLDSNMVQIQPAKDLGLGWAFVRAFIKNFSYAFIFPICCTMYFFQHNRTAYDHICGSIVVEDLPNATTR